MNKTFKVAIIGGGSSGLFCAIELLKGDNSLFGSDVLLLEATDRVGKKLVASGNGQGNLSNTQFSCGNFYGDKGFIKASLSDFSIKDLIDFYSSLGIYLIEDEEGRLYPKSMNASSVLDNIRSFLINKNLNIRTNEKVISIKYKNKFEITTSNGIFYAENCVFAFGGKSGKQFGTDGSSYQLAEKFSHKITRLYPSLVQLKTETEFLKGLKGIKERVKITALDKDKSIKKTEGDILFTDYGVSGDAVFKISSSVVDLVNPILSIEFLPSVSLEDLTEIIKNKQKLDFIPQNELLNGLVNKRTGYNLTRYAENTSPQELAKAMKDFRIRVVGTSGFDQSQVTKGGVDTNDVNPFTFKSKLQKDLYLVGELLNVDGECGGYNLSFAYHSGVKCAKAIKDKISGEKLWNLELFIMNI